MEKKHNRLPKTTKMQYHSLLDFLRENKIVLSGKTGPSETNRIQKLWSEFASVTNSKCMGPPKTPEQWKKVLNVWKANTKRKSRNIQAHLNGTGGGPITSEYLTDLEEGLLSLISKIHLGDLELSDSLDLEDNGNIKKGQLTINRIGDERCEEDEREEEECIFDGSYEMSYEKSCSVPSQNKSSKTLRDESLLEIPTVKKRKRLVQINDHSYAAKKEPQNRYTSSLLKEACEAYKEGAATAFNTSKQTADSLERISSAAEAMSQL